MELREIVAPTMKELFIKEIEGKILSGEWKIGEQLPTEREMERKMKVSRTIINSGLSELAQNCFVEIIPRKGVFVGDYMRNGHLNTLISIMNFNGGMLDRKTFDSLMAYRLQNDCECAHLAALNRTDEDLKLLLSLYEKINHTEDIAEIAQLKLDFQHAIYCATGNIIYALVCNSFKQLSLLFAEIIYRQPDSKKPTLNLLDLITAIEKKDAQEARNIMHKIITMRIEELGQSYFCHNFPS